MKRMKTFGMYLLWFVLLYMFVTVSAYGYIEASYKGIDGIIIKAHGSSKAKAIKNAIKQAVKFHESNSLTTIKDYAKKHVNNDII